AIAGFEVDEAAIKATLAKNPILITALNAVIGYEKGAAIAKQAYRERRAVLDVALEQTKLSEAELAALLDPSALTEGGIKGPGGTGG
ncbi:MAG: aspartate ammonia-lyase, partial [Nevskia sp.]|nr:aspartate ammonia-lyase [Nevskia sp.]